MEIWLLPVFAMNFLAHIFCWTSVCNSIGYTCGSGLAEPLGTHMFILLDAAKHSKVVILFFTPTSNIQEF